MNAVKQNKANDFNGVKVGFVLTGSFCTFDAAIEQAENLLSRGAELIPIMSENAYGTDTRFGTAAGFAERMEALCGRSVIHTIRDAEPIGPKKMLDVILICPCTGNTLAKLANSITDTAATMAVKAHIRNSRPAVLCIATNDALAGSARNIGALINQKNFYFTPFRQDDFSGKPASLVADFSRVPETLKTALEGKQIQPLLF